MKRVDLDADTGAAIGLCQAAHQRLLTTVEGLTDERARSASRLAGWSVAHVLTHLARNADGHCLRLEGALRGEDVARYPGGPEQRNAEIDAGARRPAGDIVADLWAAQSRLEGVWQRCADAGWPNSGLMGGDTWPVTASPAQRLREVEMHHVDLGCGYEPSDWPADYVSWELPTLLATVPGRLAREHDQQALLAWLAGRRPDPPASVELDPWR